MKRQKKIRDGLRRAMQPKNLIITVFVCGAATLCSTLVYRLDKYTENILLIYLVGVLVIIMLTKSALLGVLTSLFSVLLSNVLFTSSYFTVQVTEPDYFISSIIFVVISLFVGLLVSRLQQQVQISEQNERNIATLEREKMKSSLLRSISHDLRTPLTGIAGGTDFLLEHLDDLDSQTMRSTLEDINQESLWLSNMVENLLHMTRIQDGRLLPVFKNEVVDDILSEAVARVEKRKGCHSITILETPDILVVPMDGQLIIQVLVNLCDNAFRHTRKDSHVEILVETTEDCVVFRVTDNGGGIPDQRLDRIFDDFFTTTALPVEDRQRGIGLGLSICKAVVAVHNGRMTVENNRKGGADFSVYLPRLQNAAEGSRNE